ncbi:cell wall hydrolase/muramidase [Lactiplantibacillus plantarum]|nr:cell wall hydrolase/muramidase [Lactiplantibacillus plantarum]
MKKWSTYNKNTSHKFVELSSIVIMSSVLGIILAKPVQG